MESQILSHEGDTIEVTYEDVTVFDLDEAETISIERGEDNKLILIRDDIEIDLTKDYTIKDLTITQGEYSITLDNQDMLDLLKKIISGDYNA